MMNLGEQATLLSPADMQEGFARLSRGGYFKEASLEMTRSILTESAATVTGVERVSIWALTDDRQELRCLELYQRSTGRHTSGAIIRAERYPVYFQALAGEGAIVADAPYLHPSTAEFANDYLPQHNVSAVLDTPIHIRGELQGVLCFEQVGPRQPWNTMHRLFAQAVANLVTLALVEYEAAEARRQARHANQRLRAVFDASREAMLLADGDTGLILDANRKAEELFGYSRAALIGRHQRQLHPAWEAERCSREFRRAMAGEERAPVRMPILRADGAAIPVEIQAEVADLGDGRRLALGIFRPL